MKKQTAPKVENKDSFGKIRFTAIEWLVEQLEERGHIIPDHLEQTALNKEKQQIIDANSNGWHDGQEVIMNMLKSIDFVGKGGDDNGEQYYNETYGSETK